MNTNEGGKLNRNEQLTLMKAVLKSQYTLPMCLGGKAHFLYSLVTSNSCRTCGNVKLTLHGRFRHSFESRYRCQVLKLKVIPLK